MFSPLRKPIVLVIIILVVIVSTTMSAFKTRTAIEEAEGASKCFNTIEENISDANQTLKYAALAPKKELIKPQLDKMMVTRASADKHYAMLKANHTLTAEDQAVVDTMLLERVIYRTYQNKVRDAITQGNRQAVWDALQPYEHLKEVYILRTRVMHERMEELENDAKMVFYMNIIIIAFCTVFGTIVLYFWDRYLVFRREQHVQREKL